MENGYKDLKGDLKAFETKHQKRRRQLLGLFKIVAIMLVLILAARFIIPMVFDAAEREAQWRAERICKSHGVCDTKRGA